MQAEFPRLGGLRPEICRLSIGTLHYGALSRYYSVLQMVIKLPRAQTREHPRRRYTPVDSQGQQCWWVWMVVRFVCVIRVPVCARVSRVCPGSPRAPGVSFYRYCTVPVLYRTEPRFLPVFRRARRGDLS